MQSVTTTRNYRVTHIVSWGEGEPPSLIDEYFDRQFTLLEPHETESLWHVMIRLDFKCKIDRRNKGGPFERVRLRWAPKGARKW